MSSVIDDWGFVYRMEDSLAVFSMICLYYCYITTMERAACKLAKTMATSGVVESHDCREGAAQTLVIYSANIVLRGYGVDCVSLCMTLQNTMGVANSIARSHHQIGLLNLMQLSLARCSFHFSTKPSCPPFTVSCQEASSTPPCPRPCIL